MSKRTFTTEANPGYQQTREEVGEMTARAYFGHNNFHEISREVVATEQIRNGAWQVTHVRTSVEITYQEAE